MNKKKLLMQLMLLALATNNVVLPTRQLIKNVSSNAKQIQLQQFLKEAVVMPNVDGSSLQGDNLIYKDGLKIIDQFIKKIDNKAKVVLATMQNENKKLKDGSNLFAIKIVVGKEEKKAAVNLINVNLAKSEINDFDKIKTDIEELVISAENILTTRNTLGDAFELAKVELNKIYRDLIITINSDANEKLKENNNKLELNINYKNNSGLVTITIANVGIIAADRISKITTKFKDQAIDGSFLTIKNNINDGLKLITSEINKIEKNVNIKLVENNGKQLLVEGLNKISVWLTCENQKQFFQFQIANVANDDLQVLAKIVKILENNKINGENYTTDNTNKDIFDDLILPLIKNMNSDIIVTFVTVEQNLTEKTNSIRVNLQLNNYIKAVKIIINNVQKSLSPILRKLIKDLKPIDGSSLTVNNTYEDSITLIEKEIRSNFNEHDFTVKLISENQKLITGADNIFFIEIKVKTTAIRTKIVIKDVKQLPIDAFNNFINDLVINGIDGKSLTTNNTFGDSLQLIKDKANLIVPNIEVELNNDEDDNKELQIGTNEIEVNFTYEQNKVVKKIKINDVQPINKTKLQNIIDQINSLNFKEFGLTVKNTREDLINCIESKLRAQGSINIEVDNEYANLKVKEIKLLVSDGEENQIIKINLEDVIVSEKESFESILNLIKKNEINGSKFNSEQSLEQEEIQKVIIENINKLITKNFKNILKDEVKIKILDKQKLISGTNEVKILVQINDQSQEVSINLAKVQEAKDKVITELIKKINNLEIDGSTLTTDDNIKSGLELIKLTLKDKLKNVELFVNEALTKKLHHLDNHLRLKIKYGDNEGEVIVTIKNVKLSDYDRIKFVVEKIVNDKTNIIDGSKLTTKNTILDIKVKLKNIINEFSDDVKEKLAIEILDIKQNLKVGTNIIKVYIKSGKLMKELVITVNNVKLSDADALKEIFNKLNNLVIDGAKEDFTTASNYGDVRNYLLDILEENKIKYNFKIEFEDGSWRTRLKLGENIVTLIFKKGKETIKFNVKVINVAISDSEILDNVITYLKDKKYTIEDLNELEKTIQEELIKNNWEQVKINIDKTIELVPGTNNIKVTVKINELKKDFMLEINYFLSDQKILEKLINQIENMVFDGSNLTTNNNFVDALNLLRIEIAKLNPNVVVNLKDSSYIYDNLKEDNEIEIIIYLNDAIFKTLKIKVNNVKN